MDQELVSFEEQVLARSQEIPVLVVFWADWCGPCLMFGPILERAAASATGRWELVKVNTELQPDLAARHRIRSLPTIRLYVDGTMAAESLGALSEAGLKQWLDRHLPSPRSGELDAAEAAIGAGNFGPAREFAARVLAGEPDNDRARYLRALAALAAAPEEVAADAGAIRAGSPHFQAAAPLVELARLLLHPPDDAGKGAPDAREGLAALRRLDWDAACAAFLRLLEQDRHYGYDLAAKALKQLFLFLGPRHPVSERYRDRFSSLLFS